MHYRLLLLVTLLPFMTLGPAFAQVDLRVDRLEVTQVIQDRNVAGGVDNIIRLVGMKPTVARLYVGFTGSDQPVPGVEAMLRVYQDGMEVEGSPVMPDGPIEAPVPPEVVTRIDPRSRDEAATINFTLPLLAGGNVMLLAEVNPGRTIEETDYENNQFAIEGLNFECRRTPDIIYIPVNYVPTPESPNPNLPDPDLIALGVGDAFVQGIYPAPGLNYVLAPGDPMFWDRNINQSTSAFQNDLAARRRMFDPVPDFMYAWFAGNPYSGNGQAFPAGLVAFGNSELTRFQRTFAHELGHLFGLGHNTRFLDQVGFDVVNGLGLGRVKNTTLRDIMAAGLLTNQAWVDIATYNHFLNRPVLACPPPEEPAGASYGDYLFLTGTVNADGSASLNPAYRLTGRQDYSAPSAEATHDLVIRDGGGQEIYRLPFDARHPEVEGDTSLTGPVDSAFALTVPAFLNLARVELVQKGTVLDSLARKAQSPFVSIEPIQDVLDGKTRVAWRVSNTDPADVRYSVQFSPDNGLTWYPLAVNLAEPGYVIDPASLGKTEQGVLRVLATDGLNTAVAVRGNLKVR